jgi:hypothetical protein
MKTYLVYFLRFGHRWSLKVRANSPEEAQALWFQRIGYHMSVVFQEIIELPA